VEDALLYLDQVKVEFGDRPHIYNEFLDIMKTFKTQQIDTPGVIRRVSNLFQGNRRLVLGFNTFLPEGYKIEIDGEGPPVAVYRAPGSDVVHVLRESAESQAVSVSAAALAAGPGGTGLAYPRVDQMGARLPPQEQQILYRVGSGGGPQQPQQQQQQLSDGGMGGSPPNNNNGGMREMSQQTIKSLLPHDAGGVALRPQHLQQQQQQQPQYHQQLPGGVAPRQPMSPQKPPPKRTGMPMQQQQQQQRGLNGQPMQQQQQQHSPSQQMQQQRAAPTGFAIPLQDAAPGQPPLEFDHAINYVTTIKRRFSSEPETYKKFLEILHTYQKEQRGIKEVLDEVSELFEDHPDLLKEFTFFLPDAVQAQAKAQLDQVAKESEARKRVKAKAAIMNTAQDMQRQAQTMRIQAAAARPPPPPTIHNDTMAAPSGGIAYPQPARSSIERENNISRGAQYGVVMFDPVRPPRKNAITAAVAALKNGRPTSIPELPTLANTTEAAFFERAKIHLNRRELAADKPAGSRRHTPYTEFLKCLHLFGAGILNKEELLMLLKHLFLQGHAPKTGVNATGGNHNPLVAHDASELMHDFEEILIGRGPFAAQQRALKDKSHYGSLRTRDFDFAGCENPTPSYRTFPADYPQSLFLSNPGQSSMDASFLNKKLVCVDTNVVVSGESSKRTRHADQHHRKRKVLTMEESDGSKKRHNVYEEALTRIEEERYEIDMAIERNVHALRRIEPFAKEVQALREQEEKEGQPIGRLRYQLHRHSLNTIHINAIARIYGDRGDEILQHLLRNPLVVLPIVYQRLKQKDVEWRKVKVEMTDRWNAATVANYEGSMDVQCYPNRKALEKAFTATRLLDECKRARSYVKHPEKVKSHKATRLFQPTFAKRASDPGAVLFQPFIETAHCKVNISHKHAFQLITHKIKESPNVSAYARERMGRIWAEFVAPWFQYPTHWVLPEVRESFGGELSPNVTKCKYMDMVGGSCDIGCGVAAAASSSSAFMHSTHSQNSAFSLFASSRSGTASRHNLWGGNGCVFYGCHGSVGSKVPSEAAIRARSVVAVGNLVRGALERIAMYSKGRCHGPRRKFFGH